MSSKFDDFLQEQLQDSEIRKEYEASQPEHTVIQAEIDAGQNSGMPPKSSTRQNGYPSKYSGRFCPACPIMETGDSGNQEPMIPESETEILPCEIHGDTWEEKIVNAERVVQASLKSQTGKEEKTTSIKVQRRMH